MTIKITKGLDLSLEGEINHQVLPEVTNLTSRVAVLGKDFHGIRPTMFVSEGQQVSQGEKLFEDKKELKFVGFLKKHPHDEFSIIKIACNEINSKDDIIFSSSL